MTEPDAAPESTESKSHRTLIRVLIVQIVALALLGLLQLRYNL